MKFCPECNNLLYYQEKEQNDEQEKKDLGGLYEYCKNCGFEQPSDNIVIFSNVYKKESMKNIKTNKFFIYTS